MIINSININIINDGSLKMSSFNQYKSIFNSIKRYVGGYNLRNLPKIKNRLYELKINVASIRNYLSLLILLYKKIIGFDKTLNQFITDFKNNEMKYISKKNDVVSGDLLFYKKIMTKVKKLIRNPYNQSELSDIDLVTLYILLHISSRRNDLRFLKIFKNSPPNKIYPYINIEKKLIYFPKYKTSSDITISLKNHGDFLNLIKQIKLYPGNYLYRYQLHKNITAKELKNSQKNFTIYIKKLFKNNFNFTVTIQKLRHLAALKDPKINDIVKELRKAAELQNHGLKTHINVYMK
jgi:hypothetical protein